MTLLFPSLSSFLGHRPRINPVIWCTWSPMCPQVCQAQYAQDLTPSPNSPRKPVGELAFYWELVPSLGNEWYPMSFREKKGNWTEVTGGRDSSLKVQGTEEWNPIRVRDCWVDRQRSRKMGTSEGLHLIASQVLHQAWWEKWSTVRRVWKHQHAEDGRFYIKRLVECAHSESPLF